MRDEYMNGSDLSIGLGVLFLEILDGLLNGVFGQHRAVELDGGEVKVLGDVTVLDVGGLVEFHAGDELGGVGGGGDGTAAPEGLEHGLGDLLALLVHLDL